MKSNQKGFSLVEVMIALALMGAASYFMMEMNQSQSESMKRAISDFDIQNAVSNIQTQLKRPEICQSSLSGHSYDSNDSLIIKNDAGETLFEEGQKVGENTIQLLKTEAGDINEEGVGTLKVKIQFSRPKGVAGNKSSRVYEILILANTEKGKVTRCFSDDDLSVSNFCTALGGTMMGTQCLNLNGNYIAPGTISSVQLGDGSVSSSKIINGSVTIEKLSSSTSLDLGGSGSSSNGESSLGFYRCPVFSNGTDTDATKECGNICQTNCFGQISTTLKRCSYYIDQKISTGCKCIKNSRFQVTEDCPSQLKL